MENIMLKQFAIALSLGLSTVTVYAQEDK